VLWFWAFVVSGYLARRGGTRFPLIGEGFSRMEERGLLDVGWGQGGGTFGLSFTGMSRV